MATWNDVMSEIEDEGRKQTHPIDSVRKKYVNRLAEVRGRNVICYYSGWLQNNGSPDVSISDNDMEGLMNAVHGLDRSRGLDLVLHTPGGDLAATEAIVNYLRDCFPDDVCAIVPQIAMSAGSMIACSCNEVLMGRQSSLGPTDPQLLGVPASGILDEFERAKQEVTDNPATLGVWSQIIGKYHPTLIGECQQALEASHTIVESWLEEYMFAGDSEAKEKAERVSLRMGDHRSSAMHNRHFSYRQLREFGMKVELMEDSPEVQDAILTMHHAFMTTFQRTRAIKIIENNLGVAWMISENSTQ